MSAKVIELRPGRALPHHQKPGMFRSYWQFIAFMVVTSAISGMIGGGCVLFVCWIVRLLG